MNNNRIMTKTNILGMVLWKKKLCTLISTHRPLQWSFWWFFSEQEITCKVIVWARSNMYDYIDHNITLLILHVRRDSWWLRDAKGAKASSDVLLAAIRCKVMSQMITEKNITLQHSPQKSLHVDTLITSHLTLMTLPPPLSLPSHRPSPIPPLACSTGALTHMSEDRKWHFPAKLC